MSDAVIQAISDLSVMVIIYEGKWREKQFHPNCNSSKVFDWFEGTGTVVGCRRNRVFILSSIHCHPTATFTFFVKGEITHQIQIPATLVVNCFVRDNNGIDVAIFSCDASAFDQRGLASNLQLIHWRHSHDTLTIDSRIHLIHYPTMVCADTKDTTEAPPQDSTYRLFHAVRPTVSHGHIVSASPETFTFDSTIIATGGSSGGIIVDEWGRCLGVHDSQHDENPQGALLSTHRCICEIAEQTKHIRQLDGLFAEGNSGSLL